MPIDTDNEAAEGHAQWWHSDMKEKIGTQARKEPGAPFIMESGGPVLPALAPEKCHRALRQALTEEVDRLHADLARQAEGPELDARK